MPSFADALQAEGALPQAVEEWPVADLPDLRQDALVERWSHLPRGPVGDDGIVVCGASWDAQTYAVANALAARGAVFTVLLSDDHAPGAADPSEVLSASAGRVRSVHLRADGDKPVVFWGDRSVRLPGAAQGHGSCGAASQHARMLRSWATTLSAGLKVNEPRTQRSAGKKRQLREAARCGLRVPTTMVTRELPQAMGLFAGCETVVVKPIDGPVIRVGKRSASVFLPTEIRLCGLATLSGPLPHEVVIQQRLHPVREWRVNVVGSRVLAAARSSESDEPVDWRRCSGGFGFEQRTLPRAEAEGCVDLTRSLGLEFAGLDLIETADGFWFLEANPDATFAWLDREAGLSIADALASHLVLGERAVAR